MIWKKEVGDFAPDIKIYYKVTIINKYFISTEFDKLIN